MNFLIVDGNSMVNRSFYAIKTLTDGHGQNINGVYGFITTLRKFLGILKPEYVAIAFDVSRKTFRTNIYQQYKGTRKPTPPSLIAQIKLLQEILGLAGFAVLTCPNFEADDILGTLCFNFASEKLRCTVLTGDKDAFQLVNENVDLLMPTTRAKEAITHQITVKTIKETYGIEPSQILELKALMGDQSDNIPGCRGVGEKWACNLISRFGSVEDILANVDQIEDKSVKNKLIAGKESILLSKKLAKIVTDAPIDLNLDYYIPEKTDKSALVSRLMELDMKSVVEKIDLFVPHLAGQAYRPSSPEDLKAFKIELLFIADINKIKNKILAAPECFFSLDKENNQMGINLGENVFTMPVESNIEKLSAILLKFSGRLFVSDVKALQTLLAKHLIFTEPAVYFCSTLAGYLLDSTSKRYWQDSLIKKYLQPKEYIKYDSDNFVFGLVNMPKLCENMIAKLEENSQLSLLQEVEIPFAKLLVAMEEAGVMLDVSGLTSFGAKLAIQIEEIDLKIFEYNDGEKFNINSSSQLSEVLFNKFKLPHAIRANGKTKTDAETLKKLAEYHPVVNLVLKHRQLVKLKNTYIEGLLLAAHSDGRVHSIFNQTETKTGRISSKEPNLQNIPIRTELGSQMRKFVVAPPKMVLVDADYSQIELRILAQICQDENLVAAFKSGQDVHNITASEIFNLPVDSVTQDMRRAAKAVNFGIIYGIGAFALAEDIGVRTKDAALYIKSYFEKFPGVEKYMQETAEFARKNGFVQTLFKRRIHIPELYSSNVMLSTFGKRVAYNAPIQGSAADIIKIAMVNLRARLQKEKSTARIILQVHDEIILEALPEEADWLCEILRQEMTGVAEFCVPLEVNISVGNTWGEI